MREFIIRFSNYLKLMKRIVLAGGSGLLGRALARRFSDARYEVIILTRFPKPAAHRTREIGWDGRTLGNWTESLTGAEAVINLTGRTVDCRYTKKNRREIMNSRIESTRIIGEAIAQCAEPPTTWLNASTATIYRHTFGPPWSESGEIGGCAEAKDLFSVEVAKAWEQALSDAGTPKTRKVALRTAMVLGPGKNSVFPVLKRLARCGIGGSMGSGQQFVSWIHESDFCRAIEWIVNHSAFSGPVNICAPHPLPNGEMMKKMREACRMPIGLPASEWMLEVGAFFLRTETELIIKSRRVIPHRLLQSGFQFRFPTFRSAMEDLMNR